MGWARHKKSSASATTGANARVATAPLTGETKRSSGAVDHAWGGNASATEPPTSSQLEPPKLVRRRQNRRSTLKTGRTIGEQREHLEKASERQAEHKKAQRKKRLRIIFVSLAFVAVAIGLVVLYLFFTKREAAPVAPEATAEVFTPTIQIIDESSAAAGTQTTLSERMKNYIGQAEVDFRDLGYTPEKAVLPVRAIREVDFYLKGQPGYIKLHLDRSTAESVEDADRLIRYLREQGITTFEYLDVRLAGKAYWK